MYSMCRLCLTTGNGEDIFKNGLDKVIKDAFWIRLREKLNWPSHACETCTNFLGEMKAFKAKIERSQEHLEQLASQVVIKVEPNTDTPEDMQKFLKELESAVVIKEEPREEDDNSDVSLNWEAVDLPSPEKAEQEGDDFSDVSSVSFCMKWEVEDSSSSERAEQDHEEVRSPSPLIVPAKKARTQRRKPISTSEILFDEESSESDGTSVKSKPMELRKAANKSKRSPELRASLEEQLKKMNLLRCNKCQFEANSLEELKMHYKDQHQTVGYVTCCNIKLVKGAIYDHMEYHLDKNRFKCHICEKKMKSNKQLMYHQRKVHPKPQDCKFICKTCGKGFGYPSLLKDHVRKRHNPTKCNTCGKLLANVHSLKRHIHRSHTERKPKECDICGKQFFKLKEHKKNSHVPKVTIKCEHCGKELLKRHYAQHVHRVHSKLSKVYKCNVCGKELKRLDYYRTHMDMHTGVKYYRRVFGIQKSESIKVRTKGAHPDAPNCSNRETPNPCGHGPG